MQISQVLGWIFITPNFLGIFCWDTLQFIESAIFRSTGEKSRNGKEESERGFQSHDWFQPIWKTLRFRARKFPPRLFENETKNGEWEFICLSYCWFAFRAEFGAYRSFACFIFLHFLLWKRFQVQMKFYFSMFQIHSQRALTFLLFTCSCILLFLSAQNFKLAAFNRIQKFHFFTRLKPDTIHKFDWLVSNWSLLPNPSLNAIFSNAFKTVFIRKKRVFFFGIGCSVYW